MSGRTAVRPDRYAYISGRIMALELNLLDSSRYARLFDAGSQEDIGRVLAESGYPDAADPETSLYLEQGALYGLLRELMPDRQFIDILLMFHDFHNIKVGLKYLSPWWLKPDEETQDREDMPELAAGQEARAKPSLQAISNLLLQPALINPPDLFQAMAERQRAFSAALSAVRSYQSSYDVADIDLVLDRLAFSRALAAAQDLDNEFFCQYLQKRVDLANLGILLRVRHLQSGSLLLRKSLLPGGLADPEAIVSLYGADGESVHRFISAAGFPALAEYAQTYGRREIVTRFGQEVDNILMRHIGKARLILSGPEIPLAYLFAREMEIRNVRIILACLRNGLPSNRARAMMRDNYLAWR